MKGKKLAAKIMLGLLLATPYSFAEANYVGTIYVDTVDTKVTPEGEFEIGNENSNNVAISQFGNRYGILISNAEDNGTINANKSISIGNGASVANGTLTIGNGTTEKVTITGGTTHDGLFVEEGHVLVKAKEIKISTGATKTYGAIWIKNNTQDQNAPSNASSVTLNAENIEITSPNLGIAAHSNAQLNINGNLMLTADEAIDTRGNSTININMDGMHTTVINGDIVFETPNTPSDPQDSGNLINSNVNINFSGAESSFNGSAYKAYPNSGVEGDYMIDHNDNNHYGNVTDFNLIFDNNAAWNMTDDSFVNDVTLTNGGIINVQSEVNRFNVDDAEINSGIINLQGEDQEVNVITMNGNNGHIEVGSDTNKITVGTLNGESTNFVVNGLTEKQIAITTNNSTNLQVTGTSAATDNFDENNLVGSLQSLADTVDIQNGEQLNNVVAQEGVIFGQLTAKLDDNGNIIAGSVVEEGNIANEGITELANVALMAWRAENDEMHQRMGELRSSTGEAGIWARMKRGESESGDMGITNQYNTYQLGYDEKVGDSNWYLGGAISRTEGKSSFATGSGENQSTGFTVYGTYVGDDGQYVDLSAKYARLDNEFDVFGRDGIESTGDYRNNGYAFSAEYGKRIEAGNDFWVEPQVQLTYGHLSSANYTTSRGVKAAQDAMDSVVGRVGFAAGKDISAGNVYVKASYLYDFDGETAVSMTDGKNSAVYEQDLGGGWFEFGIGTNINLSETSHLYFDVERAVGGDIDTPWQWNAGVRFDF